MLVLQLTAAALSTTFLAFTPLGILGITHSKREGKLFMASTICRDVLLGDVLCAALAAITFVEVCSLHVQTQSRGTAFCPNWVL